MNALELKNLTKSFGAFTLGPLSFTLPNGCILGLIGQNGAGKSTTIRLLLQLLRRDSGEISILGSDGPPALEHIGVVLDEIGLPESLTVRQIGAFLRRIFRTWNIEQYMALLQKFSIPDRQAFGKLSLGMKKKLAIAIALSHDSKLLLFDEATSGLDPVARSQVIELLNDFTREEARSVLLSSHIVSDLEKICDYIAFLHRGKLLIFEEKDRLLAQYGLCRLSRCDLNKLPTEAIVHREDSPYGIQAVVTRALVPEELSLCPISLEELFVAMAKEAE